MSNDWDQNYTQKYGVDPNDYADEDDFLSARASAQRSEGKPFGIAGENDRKKQDGCYIATCVYGSYDCPQVFRLRRFRDTTLASSTPGRAFIRAYYAISPKLVAWFGHNALIRRSWRAALHPLNVYLERKGVSNEPYSDRTSGSGE